MRDLLRTSAKLAITASILLCYLPASCRDVWADEPQAASVPDAAAPAGTAATPDRTAPDPSLVRITSSIESKFAAAMLRQVARLFSSGFTRRDSEAIAHQIDALPADQKQLWQFTTVYKGVQYPLQIRARVDDFGMLDLDFYVPAAIAKPVRNAVDDYLNKHGG